ncbi:MAG: non-hydrolyzing UDP-N-acetylglucosamine 2-epimerase [Gemmatimonadaceae bacterium]
MKKVLTVVGARPQFVKSAVVSRQLRQREQGPPYQEILIHTGQHYDDMMSDVFFRELEMQPPAKNLDVGSHNPASQIALMLQRLDPIVVEERPDAVMVYGDTNSTLAGAIVAMHRDVPLIHVEAGERIFRRAEVPEEANRVLTDHAASLCLTSTQRATSNLRREGMGPDRVRFVGDPMYDLFYWARSHVGRMARVSPASFGLVEGEYHLATIHRVQNTTRELLLSLFDALDRASEPVLMPVHPRVRRLLDEWRWQPQGSLRLTEPLGYFDFLAMLLSCRKVVTDSGGVTREAFFARRPCIVPMQNSWWTEIVEAGWAVETGDDAEAILHALESFTPPNEAPDGLFGDGQSGERIVQEVDRFLATAAGRDGAWHPHGTFDLLPKVKASAFTHRNYRAFLGRFQDAGYYFASFEEAPALLDAKKPFVLLRHDIDLDLGRALRMAELEASMGVHSTYFLLLRTNHYNALSAEGSDLVRRMLAFGHHLGLHFDVAAYAKASTAEDLAAACAREIDIMQRWFDRRITMVSYHRPNALVLTGDPAFSAPLPHTYMETYTKRIRYMSDSRGQWRDGDPTGTDTFREGKPLHVLVHPIWWGDVPASPYQALQTYVSEKQLELEQSVARNSASYRVGWLTEDLPR